MLTEYYQKNKEVFQKTLVKGNKVFLKKKNKMKKRANMLVSDIEIFLKKKKKTSVNMVVSNTKII